MCSPIQFKQKSSLQTGLENEINDQLNNFSEEGKINKWETSIEEEEKNEENKYRLFTKYYFDSVTAQCYAFSTQNCGGNQNRFESIEECLNICKLLA
ncbi:BPTI/Kunitz inhibitor domain-containing protein [Meloidogyne graminicola]|uniref:BPTI/Kunitz inhibitor domain-containing protein n=1 Tax=Meloidogyne graminicola TaxID=189291 RepID=A0A8S9Z9A9_9BILA|nr:BPTI/Kunitz inhibitor domain-containing protein [Meloidogyne graminicola]